VTAVTDTNFTDVLARLRARPLYPWGAAQTGIGVLQALRRLGISPVAFIDKRWESLRGGVSALPVVSLADALTRCGATRPLILNTSTLHTDAISLQCEEAGLSLADDFLSYEQLCPVDFQVIVSSVCNLRCISCPVGNRADHESGSFMNADNYTLVLDKILSEVPLVSIVQLFNWGEPFLNPQLARIVEVTNSRGVLCSISSNLNLRKDFSDVIAAKPAFVRVSMSGTPERYAVTHTGGQWELFLCNMESLAELRARLHPDMTVEVAYHVYATTTPADMDRARALCDRLGFVFRPHLAALLPLDNVLDHVDGKPLSAEAQQTLDMLKIPLDQALTLAREQRHMQCSFERTLNIESDLSVRQCGLWVRAHDNRVVNNFLTTPLSRIMELRRASRLCPLCKAQGLHRFCSVYTDRSTAVETPVA